MLLDSSQFEKSIQDCAKLIRQQQRHEKDLQTVREELDRATGKLVGTTQQYEMWTGKTAKATDAAVGATTKVALANGSLTESFIKATGVMNLAGAAFSFVKEQIADSLERGMEWGEDVRGNEAEVSRLKEAVGGLGESVELAGMREKLLSSSVKATTSEIEAAGKAAVIHARINNEDLGGSFKSMADHLVGGRGISKLMRELGITFVETGDKTQDIKDALHTLEVQFGSTNITAENTKEKVEQLGSSWKDFKGRVGDAILQSEPVQSFLNGMTFQLGNVNKELAKGVGLWQALKNAGIGDVQKQIELATKAAKDKAQTAERDAALQSTYDWVAKYNAEERKRKTSYAGSITIGGIPITESDDIPDWNVPTGSKKKTKKIGEEYGGRLDAQVEKLREQEKALEDIIRLQERLDEVQAGEKRDDAARAAEREHRASEKYLTDLDKKIEKHKALAKSYRDLAREAKGTVVGAMADIGGAMWGAADAAIQGSKGFGAAMADMTKSTLLGVAQQATVRALFETAEGIAALAIMNYPGAMLHFSSAGTFGIIAGVAGAAGLAISAATAPSGSGAAGGYSSPTGDSYRPSYGKSESNRTIEIVVNNYMGGRDDLGAIPYTQTRTKKLLAA